MHFPAQAILWHIYWRCRWGFIAVGALLLVATVLTHTLPTHWTIPMGPMGDGQVPAVGWCLGMACLFSNLMLMAAFSMSGEDARQLTFAKHLLVLPVRTSTLVAWPLVSGCLTVAAVWWFNASLVFRPSGIAAPVWWPAAALALFLATFQALAWTPIAQRWLHGVLSVAVIMSPIVVLLLSVLLDIRVSEVAASAVLIALIPVAYLAAHSGVARARRHEFYDWQAWCRFTKWLARRRPAATYPFRSIRGAQLWYECRAHLIVPVFIGCMLPCFLFVPVLQPHDVALGWRLLGMLLGAPVIVAILAGGPLGNLVDPLSKHKSSTFVLVRPISTMALVRAKFVVAAVLTAAIWIFFLAYTALLLLRPGFGQSIQRVASGVPAWQAIGYPILALCLLVLFSWKSMAETLWIGLTGRKWVELANAVGIAGIISVGIGCGIWLTFLPGLQRAALALVPWLMGVLLVVKLTAAACVMYRLLQLGLITAGGAKLMAALWLAVVAALSGLALALLPPELASPAKIIPGVALLVPFARLLGAPLALQWNRHR